MTVDDNYEDQLSYVPSLSDNSAEDFAFRDGRKPPTIVKSHNSADEVREPRRLSRVEDVYFIPGEFQNGNRDWSGMSVTYLGMGRPLTIVFSTSPEAVDEAANIVRKVDDAFPESVNLHMVGGEPSEETIQLYRRVGLAPCSEPNFVPYDKVPGPRETLIKEALDEVNEDLSDLEQEVLFS